jgi:phosphoglycolate phosphatase
LGFRSDVARIKAVFFDVDGVLLNSLPAHLQITRDLGREYNLEVTVPTIAEFKTLIRERPVSPMKRFFESCGFPEPLAELANQRYRTEFHANYTTPLYAGVPDLLAALSAEGIPLGIATLNILSNIVPSLGDTMRFFEAQCQFEGGDARAQTKAQALEQGAQALGLNPGELLLVGDQLGDYAAARTAGTQFLGVTYGWDIDARDTDFPTTDSVPGIAQYVLQRRALFSTGSA